MDRKKDHIGLAFKAQSSLSDIDERFDYEPVLGAHPSSPLEKFTFLGKTFEAPIWVSSMTGGTQLAKKINTNLARACKEFGLGMGLGSCRNILFDNSGFDDFDMRDIIGNDRALFANLGISQLEDMVAQGTTKKIDELIDRLRADGIIIHVNPLQEWIQPEGDRFKVPPIDTIERFLERCNYKVIVKEVGQGMGPASLKRLLELPLAAIEFGAFGGTNFARLELMRQKNQIRHKSFEVLAQLGNNAESMLDFVNSYLTNGFKPRCPELIISGGVKNFLDGYYLIGKSKLPAIYGQASSFLSEAREDYDKLRGFVQSQIEGFKLAKAFLHIKK